MAFGVTPRHFANDDGINWVDHSTLGRKTDKKFGIAGDQIFKPQTTTTTYLGNNCERILIINSEIFEHTNKGYDGTRGWFKNIYLNREKISSRDLINTLNLMGHEHHYAVSQGNLSKNLLPPLRLLNSKESKELLEIASWNDLKLVKKIKMADYLSPFDIIN